MNLLYIYLELYSEQATGLTPREAAEEVVHDARGGLGRKAQDDADREAGEDAAQGGLLDTLRTQLQDPIVR